MLRVKFNEWMGWSVDNPIQFGTDKSGVGQGESKFAWEVGGTIQGSNSSYDVVDVDGDRWEVKALVSTNEFRTGVDGITVMENSIKNICDVSDQISLGFSDDNIAALVKTVSYGKKRMAKRIAEFAKKDLKKIRQGSISVGRMLGNTHSQRTGLLQALEFVRDEIINRSSLNGPEIMRVECAGEHIVSISDYAKIASILNIDCASMSPIDRIACIFSHDGFKDPKKFIDDNWFGIRPSAVFKSIAGIAIVTSSGFYAIPANEFDARLKFVRVVSGWRPTFKFMN